MSVDLTKLILHSGYNAFKNANVYTGSLNLPASVPPDSSTPTQTTTTITLPDKPVFTVFFAFYNDIFNALSSINDPEWYNMDASGQFNVAYPATFNASGNVECLFYPVINGNVVTVTARAVNQTATTYTATINVPFVFVDYTLAN